MIISLMLLLPNTHLLAGALCAESASQQRTIGGFVTTAHRSQDNPTRPDDRVLEGPDEWPFAL
jgi:hypothetical protein